ncbi:MAG: mechanosensitive ion channel family protein [Treponema sp.]|jgi:small-conductance mechanosensitive channel|nr:mechanosensitive ion channel family protein [Treponema sp.]
MKFSGTHLLAFLCVLFLSFPPLMAQEGDALPGDTSPPAETGVLEDTAPQAETSPSPAAGPPAAGAPLHEEFPGENVTRDIEDAVAEESLPLGLSARIGIAAGIVAGQVLLIWLVWLLFKIIAKKLTEYGSEKIKPLTIKKLKLLNTKQILNVLLFLLKILKYLITIFQLFITIPIVFSLFPLTKDLAATIFGYILNPLKNILFGTIHYIPNLVTIVIIVWITRYVIRALKFFTTQIARGKLVVRGFYADWAEPTFNILRVLLWAFTVAIIYPYLPGSESRIFQGVSVFVGIIFSLGSSSAIGNLVAGLVITYMRPFKIGDRIQIKDITGFVVEKTLMVIRLKTHKNEYVTFPNLMILNSSIVNYNTSSDEDEEGLLLYATITFGYNTPWQTVHKILIDAALKTSHVQKSPKPFVLQTAMNDFYANYQINLYTKEVDKAPAIYSRLYENIQTGFHEAGIDMTAAHYRINLPSEPYKPPDPVPGTH